MIEIEIGKCLESVHVDNGSDYRGLFKNYHELCGIKLEMIPGKTPMLNSATDKGHGNRRKIKHIFLMQNFLSPCIGEVIRIVVDLINLALITI